MSRRRKKNRTSPATRPPAARHVGNLAQARNFLDSLDLQDCDCCLWAAAEAFASALAGMIEDGNAHRASEAIAVFGDIHLELKALDEEQQKRWRESQEEARARWEENGRQHRLAMQIPCPYCKMPAGRRCRSSTGLVSERDHVGRTKESQALAAAGKIQDPGPRRKP